MTKGGRLPQEGAGIRFITEDFHPTIFRGLHFAAIGGFQVIISSKVEDAVHSVAEDFFRVGGVEFNGLAAGYCGADVAFAGEVKGGGIVLVIEGDDVGAAFVLEEFQVDPGHFLFVDEVYTQFEAGEVEVMFEELEQDLAEAGQVDGGEFVALADSEDPGWSRWQSGGLHTLG